MHKRWLVAATVVALSPVNGGAQKSNTRGLMANVHLNGVGITRPKDGTTKRKAESGGGAGARLGWGFSPNFTIYAGLDVATLDFKDPGATGDFVLAHFDLIVIYHFANANRKFIPYIEIGGTGRAIGATIEDPTGNMDFVQGGSGWTAGGGFNYYFTRAAALNLGLQLSGGKFEDAEIDKTTIADTGGEVGSSRLNIGMTFYPMKR